MAQKINPYPAPGCNRSPPIMYFQKMQFHGVFRPFLQRSLPQLILPEWWWKFLQAKMMQKTVFIMNGLWGQIAYPSKKWLALPFLIPFAIFPNCGILFKDKGNYFSSLYWPHIMITMKENLRKKTQHETFDWAFFFKLQYRARLNKKKW